MISKPTLQDAIALATKYHEGQVDKGGKPYISHPLRVMENMMLEDEKITNPSCFESRRTTPTSPILSSSPNSHINNSTLILI